MVGLSGKLEPTIRAVETVDRELGRIYQAVKQRGGSLLVTADHGNAEMLIDPATGGPHTAHTTNPVPFIFVTDAPSRTVSLRAGGSLRDISPTMLALLRMDQPGDMTGESLKAERKSSRNKAQERERPICLSTETTRVGDMDSTLRRTSYPNEYLWPGLPSTMNAANDVLDRAILGDRS